MFDFTVIGGGVIGGAVLRELTKYNLNVLLVEKESDVCMGQSKANSGIVHAGYDAKEGSLKAKFNVLGNVMMPKYAEELGVKYRNNGSLVVAYSEDEIDIVYKKMQEIGTDNYSAFCRKMTVDGYVIKQDFTDIKKLIFEINKIGTNINQIAKN